MASTWCSPRSRAEVPSQKKGGLRVMDSWTCWVVSVGTSAAASASGNHAVVRLAVAPADLCPNSEPQTQFYNRHKHLGLGRLQCHLHQEDCCCCNRQVLRQRNSNLRREQTLKIGAPCTSDLWPANHKLFSTRQHTVNEPVLPSSSFGSCSLMGLMLQTKHREIDAGTW